MRATQRVASMRTALVTTCNDHPQPFSMTPASLAVFDWIIVHRHPWNQQRPLLVMAALVAGLLMANHLVLGVPLGDALIFLVCWPFDDGIFFRI